MNATGRARLRIAAVLAVALVVQTTLATDVRVAGVAPDLMLLVAICGGLVGGPESGAIVGFCSGLLADLTVTTTPVGLTALSWCLVGWAVGGLRATLLPEARLFQPVVGLLASAGGVLVFVVAAGLAGQTAVTAPGQTWLLRVVVVESVWNAVLVLPVAALMAWAARGSRGAERLGRADVLVAR